MQTNETEMGYTATFNHICKKKHVHIFCMFPKIILIVALEIEFFFLSIHLSRFPPFLTWSLQGQKR